MCEGMFVSVHVCTTDCTSCTSWDTPQTPLTCWACTWPSPPSTWEKVALLEVSILGDGKQIFAMSQVWLILC